MSARLGSPLHVIDAESSNVYRWRLATPSEPVESFTQPVITLSRELGAQGGLQAMEFDPAITFAENLQRFKDEAERLDPECAQILFDNIGTLTRQGDGARDRQAIQEFNRAVLAALNALPDSAR